MNIYDVFMSPLEKRILTRIRKNIIPMAFGNVLEIGYGTGVNFQYYNSASITNFSALDKQSVFSLKDKTKFPINFFAGYIPIIIKEAINRYESNIKTFDTSI